MKTIAVSAVAITVVAIALIPFAVATAYAVGRVLGMLMLGAAS